jgi:hydrophobic/amphiphilic exporter-1 (mainly G- bacteria), HAE1 family
MKVIESSIRYPVTTTVAAVLLVLFGMIALFRIPVQLTPTIEEPEITIFTFWPGASPQEVEREIVDRQEEQLKSLEGLVKMDSSSADSRGSITLTFTQDTDVNAALLRVSNRLDQVRNLPADADRPVIQTVGENQNAIAWFLLLPQDPATYQGDVTHLLTFVEDFVKPEFERVSGVGRVNVFGGLQREMQVVLDPEALASRRITVPELLGAIERENRNFSAGDFTEGKRRYIVRTVGEYGSAADIEQVVVAVRDGIPVYVRDVATVELGFAKPFARAYYLGEPMIAFNAVREPGSNVLDVMDGLKATLGRVNSDLLAERELHIVQAYDETEYIDSAISLVKQSLMIGGTMAILVLLLFLRSGSTTLIVAVAIPISVIGTFLMMNWFGRSINVISLAGMAFAVGMVVDSSIVVLENIYRHRQLGKTRIRAAHDGAVEVWRAVLASTLTTIAVFVPVLFIQDEAGQLFRDIAIAISCAVGLSLIVAITVIPSMSAKVLGTAADASKGGFHGLWGLVDRGHRFNDWITEKVYWITGSTFRRLAVVIGFTTVAITLSFLLAPKAEYLPTGNRNLLFGIILPSPGHSLEENAELRKLYAEELSYLWTTPESEAAALPGGGLRGWFYIALNDRVFMGARSADPSRARELLPVFQEINAKVPGAIAFVSQPSLFQRGIGQGRNIDIQLSGPDLPTLYGLGGEVFGRVRQVLPEAQARPIPGLDLGNPEVQVRTHRQRSAEAGLSHRELAATVSTLVDGAKASDYRLEGQEIDLRVIGDRGLGHRTHLIEQLPIATSRGDLVTIGSVAEVELVNGPAEIAHRERQRAVTIAVTPPETMPLQEAMDRIEREILQPLRAEGQIGGLYQARLAGTADKLTQTGRALVWNFILAIVITYLLMSALFENFIYPLVILFSVPLAAFGGFLGLGFVNLFTYQALDVLTMLGFIILVGTVVNNAILIVHQSLHHIRDEAMAPREAIRESVKIRIRPIFMSVSTSVTGMLPLVLFPGAGSELYRGLGSVVIGGLLVSTIFTLFLVPSLFSLVMDAKTKLAERLERVRPAEVEA